MKRFYFIIGLFISFTLTSCTKEATSKGDGWVVFTTASNARGSVYVTVDGKTENRSKVGVLSNPDYDCNIYKGYNGSYLLEVGPHTYTATADDGTTWSGRFEILTDDDCVKVRLP